ncbi:hypothetical protein K450DRAFT_221168 [Umbelopsis ramanniana AG]|uniref:Conserved oligomeric Golgi complex subunit 6 n=1 Tax=Umbelopsis ramanniana AG TaxID=1314678 RepID=A0AAD5HJ70_UMBRA|nr:uncharacterized protein K450DRAFT_221168 [Umbelopsis ramanniana AG]KAI8584028.1 hypothetical protein K450DRAFT_221168 [Umbelopsis ramanniana AG]
MDDSTAPVTPTSLARQIKNPLSIRLSHIYNTVLHNSDKTKNALTTLSQIPNLQHQDLDKNLRGVLERNALEANQRFLLAFSKLDEHLLILENDVNEMQASNDAMTQQLTEVNKDSSLLIEQVTSLQNRRSACDIQRIIIDSFLSTFMLTDQEIEILCSPSAPVDAQFFKALDHLQQVHSDCRLLLMTEHQQAGLDILESLAGHQETAYEKLYKWTQRECQSSFNREFLEISSLMKRATKALKHKPVLFQACLEDMANIRRNSVTRAFIDALTRGGPGGTPRPIELQAHDPIRYIGDMLAWVHQAAASEREILEGLFDVEGQRGYKRSVSQGDIKSSTDGPNNLAVDQHIDETITGLLGRIMDGTCRPLKSRIEQVLISQPGAITSYKIANIIQFYTITIGKLFSSSASLPELLHSITDVAFKTFYGILNAQANKLLRFSEKPGNDLMPPSSFKEVVLQLKEIMASYDSSLIIVSGATAVAGTDFRETLDAMIDPLLQICDIGAEKLSDYDRLVYKANCLQYVRSALILYAFTEIKRQSLEKHINELLESLTDKEYQLLLQQSGLDAVDSAIKSKDINVPLSSLEGMDARALGESMAHLDRFLTTIDGDIPSRLTKLSSSRLARQVHGNAIKQFIDAYRHIIQAVSDPSNGYEFPASILPRTVEEIETIFSFATE